MVRSTIPANMSNVEQVLVQIVVLVFWRLAELWGKERWLKMYPRSFGWPILMEMGLSVSTTLWKYTRSNGVTTMEIENNFRYFVEVHKSGGVTTMEIENAVSTSDLNCYGVAVRKWEEQWTAATV
ncbi:hypothetical protein F3Y22_tig00109971pilonHSYRG00076 [Hibiscus syriacus]|uniref:Uncharacterized protein n=1 Tax=Hibiscus syriacus TaxID=106335 RepID=A0A6A3BQZ4_HIBSY|nr:hypothetical protein F3Y22_tig00109971pilonHSYRG00076 [Hibiscus syriacus]